MVRKFLSAVAIAALFLIPTSPADAGPIRDAAAGLRERAAARIESMRPHLLDRFAERTADPVCPGGVCPLPRRVVESPPTAPAPVEAAARRGDPLGKAAAHLVIALVRGHDPATAQAMTAAYQTKDWASFFDSLGKFLSNPAVQQFIKDIITAFIHSAG